MGVPFDRNYKYARWLRRVARHAKLLLVSTAKRKPSSRVTFAVARSLIASSLSRAHRIIAIRTRAIDRWPNEIQPSWRLCGGRARDHGEERRLLRRLPRKRTVLCAHVRSIAACSWRHAQSRKTFNLGARNCDPRAFPRTHAINGAPLFLKPLTCMLCQRETKDNLLRILIQFVQVDDSHGPSDEIRNT